MQIPVLIEPVAGNGYRARGAEPFALSAEGATREEALANFRGQLQSRMKSGAAIVALEVPVEEHPFARSAGIFSPDDPLVQEWLSIMAENRRKADENPDLP
jgi:hypothetical protein